jgi:hypothetical protein
MDVTFLKSIDDSVKTIMKDGKIDISDVPEMVMLVTKLVSVKKMTQDEMVQAIEGLFEYIMDHYKLFPDNEAEKEMFTKIFDMSVKLVMFTPTVKKLCCLS